MQTIDEAKAHCRCGGGWRRSRETRDPTGRNARVTLYMIYMFYTVKQQRRKQQ